MIDSSLEQIVVAGMGKAKLSPLTMALEQFRKATLGHPDSIFHGIDVDEKSENPVAVGGPVGTGVDMY